MPLPTSGRIHRRNKRAVGPRISDLMARLLRIRTQPDGTTFVDFDIAVDKIATVVVPTDRLDAFLAQPMESVLDYVTAVERPPIKERRT